MNISQFNKELFNNTDLHHCLMGECMNTEGAKQAAMIEYWLMHKTYLFGDIHQWMSSYENIKEHLKI